MNLNDDAWDTVTALLRKRNAELDRLNAERKAEGRLIDPQTAEVTWQYGEIIDPYGDDGLFLADKERQIGRVYFARDPQRRYWVAFQDLPPLTAAALWQEGQAKLASRHAEVTFPAGMLDLTASGLLSTSKQ